MSSCWQLLEIEPINDEQVIRKAYRKLLPKYHPETDPEGFRKLREAYEEALKLATTNQLITEQQQQPVDQKQIITEEILASYKALLADSSRRLTPEAWHSWIDEVLNQQPLAIIEHVYWPLLWEILNVYIHSHQCINILINRLNWQSRLLDLDTVTARDVSERLKQFSKPDLFDYSCLSHLPFEVQQDVIWYFVTCNIIANNEPPHVLYKFLNNHCTIYIPSEPSLLKLITQWLCFAGISSSNWTHYIEQQLSITTDPQEIIDWQYWQATQYDLSEQYKRAYPLWLNLANKLPQAEEMAINYCHRFSVDYLPLLILALNKPLTERTNWILTTKTAFSSLRLASIYNYATLPIAQDFINDHLETDNIKFTYSILRKNHNDLAVYKLYYYAWILKYGDESLLQLILHERSDGEMPIHLFILEQFKQQATQLLALFANDPTISAVKDCLFNENKEAHNTLKALNLNNPQTKNLIDLWLNRLRWYEVNPLATLKKYGYFSDIPEGFINSYLFFLHIIECYQMQWLKPADIGPDNNSSQNIWLWQQLTLFIINLLSPSNNNLLINHKSWLHTLPANNNHWVDEYIRAMQELSNQTNTDKWKEKLLDWLTPGSDTSSLLLIYQFSCQQYFELSPLQQNTSLLFISLQYQYAYYLLKKELPEELILLCIALQDLPQLKDHQRQQVINIANDLVARSYLAESIYKLRENNSPKLKEHSFLRLKSTDSRQFIDFWIQLARNKKALSTAQISYLNKLRNNINDSILSRLTAETLLSYKKPNIFTKLSLALTPSSDLDVDNDIENTADNFKNRFLKLLSARGRIGRVEYMGQLVLLFLLAAFCFVLVMLLISISDGFFSEFYIATAIIICGFRFYVITTRRLHDIGRSTSFFLLFIIIALITRGLAILALILIPGQATQNEYGPPPK